MEKVLSAIKDVKGMVFDLDRNLHRSTITMVLGCEYLRRERTAGRAFGFYKNIILSAIANAPLIGPRWDHNHTGVKAGGIKWGTRILFDTLAKCGASKSDVYTIASKHIEKAAIPQTHALLKNAIINRKPVFLTTTGTDIGPTLYSKKYNVRAWLANRVDYKGEKITGCTIKVGAHNIASSIESMLNKHNIRLDECAIVADDRYYLPAMRKAAVSIASPLARKAVKRGADFCL